MEVKVKVSKVSESVFNVEFIKLNGEILDFLAVYN